MIRELRELPDFIPSLSSPIKGVEDPMGFVIVHAEMFRTPKRYKDAVQQSKSIYRNERSVLKK